MLTAGRLSTGQMGDGVNRHLVLKLHSGGEFEFWGVGASSEKWHTEGG